MAGLVPATSLQESASCAILVGMPGTSPGMTVEKGGEKIRSRVRDLDSQRALNLLHPVAFDHVALSHVLVIFEGHAAFHAGTDFAHIILETLKLR
jgi:hypothetical protein